MASPVLSATMIWPNSRQEVTSNGAYQVIGLLTKVVLTNVLSHPVVTMSLPSM